MIDADANAVARLEARGKGLVYLVDMDFRTASVYFNTSSEPVAANGRTYIGAGSLVDFPGMKESEDSSNAKLVISISLVNQAMKAATIGDAGEYRLRPLRVYLQMMDEKFLPDGAPILRWRGYMDKIKVEKAKEGSSMTGRIRMECVKPGLARARRYEGLRLTHQQHVIDNPTDRGLEYMQELINTPAPWLTVEFQKQ